MIKPADSIQHQNAILALCGLNPRVPATGSCKGGIVARSDGHALPAQTLRAFLITACSVGTEPFARCKVVDISRGKEGFSVVAEDGRIFTSEVVINCAGAWGKTLLHF